MSFSIEAKTALMRAVRDAQIKVIGYDLVKNDAEAWLLTAIIKAYGGSAAGFIYASPSRARSTLRPPDVVLCHPDVGLLIIEAKGHTIDVVHGIEAGSIMVRYEGRTRPENAVRQVEDQMFEIDSDIMKLVRDRRQKPLLNCMVTFPNISESDWVGKGYDKAHPSSQLLFKEQIENQSRLKQRISNLVQHTLNLSRKPIPLTLEQVDNILQVFGNSDVINERRAPRSWVEENRLGSEIDEMVALDKYLSEEQKNYSKLKIEGYPRLIRGVAGSGKSVVLANLVARYLHRRLQSLDDGQFPETAANVGVVCYNQALVSFLRKKIRIAYREQTLNEDIPSTVLQVTHLNDLMWSLKEQGWPIDYIRIRDVKDNAERACLYRQQIKHFAETQPDFYANVCFDVMFVDEGQDLEPEEYSLLLDLIKPAKRTGEKPLIIFYDDAQNLYGRPRPVWNDLDINVRVGDRSRVMRECFRNTRQIVELAFNVLLGSQSPPDVRVQTRTYADVAYLKDQNLLEEVGDHFRVNFSEREYRKPLVCTFTSPQDEISWVASEVGRLINGEQVRPEDILIVFYRPSLFEYKSLKGAIQNCIPSIQFIEPFGDSEDKKSYIFQPNAITISTVYGAKGYDAPIVFVVGVDAFPTEREGRAAFYVAATRSKLLLYVTGAESSSPNLLHEAQKVLEVI